MIPYLDGRPVEIAPCSKCGCHEHTIAFAKSNLSKLWSTCANCEHKRPVALDAVYEAIKKPAGQPALDALFEKC